MALEPPSTPPLEPVDPLYPDDYARKLAELRAVHWHMPESTIAELLGFENTHALRGPLRSGSRLEPRLLRPPR